ncbi:MULTISPECIES: cyclic nucleotide-binding domain-containing protein [Psychrilyobacter]|uniref:Cyclic nucleotide-binding domain-containing protein n=1 Tax=Psychrilyobacter piezotolerans TaxID=2293438 RepID=A0ABX9KEG9_9FUSO|nr:MULTISPECIES: cyclic nucleotide-binding domain-containing protein [Psychrilyobacter]MCS5421974.1 cyclic nucleotide-binding domain-containing protein [Psychrilyobacter sp. S5]NDI78831.1 cyclic nucleotide-binding domain-containing protein [Psychrilyobacter piezotolerans]RDE59434.1 cyclic nucleotide-binding domain-containing protein [Psychrilyobacter sp. S5]REI39904.1 cyclic nucleotide-binding domain-containing protein [Psychrilyobacter piezotolerans]
MSEDKLKKKIIELLPKTSLFGGVEKVDLDSFIETLSERSYIAGENIFEEGGSPGDSYLLLEGEVKLTVIGRRLFKIGPGRVFGIASPLGIQKQIVTATADTDIVLAVIPKMTLYLLEKENPRLFGKIILNEARDLARALKGMKEIILDYILMEEEGNL